MGRVGPRRRAIHMRMIHILYLVHRRIDIRRRQVHVDVLLSLICIHRWGDMRDLIRVRVDVDTCRHVKVWVQIHGLRIHARIDVGSTHAAAGCTGSGGWGRH